MQLTLTPQEHEVLLGAIESVISDIGTEVGHTDNQAMRQDLHERKSCWQFLTGSKLPSEGVSVSEDTAFGGRRPT